MKNGKTAGAALLDYFTYFTILTNIFVAAVAAYIGNFTGKYPYPFVDVGNLGWKKVFTNSAILFFVFLTMNFWL